MLEKVSLSKIYPCKRVTLGSELLYISELGKYLSQRGMTLSLDGIILDNILRESRFWLSFRVAVTNGWVCDVGNDMSLYITEVDLGDMSTVSRLKTISNICIQEDVASISTEEKMKRVENPLYNILTPTKTQTFFDKRNPNCWLWDFELNWEKDIPKKEHSDHLTTNILGIRDEKFSQNIVSILAYVAVEKYCCNPSLKFQMYFGNEVVVQPNSLVDVCLIDEQTYALDGWCDFIFADNISAEQIRAIGYETWYHQGREEGMLARAYDIPEKMEYFRHLDIVEGDVVYLYERTAKQESNTQKVISSWHYAIVRKITSRGVDLEIINDIRTPYGKEQYYNSLTTAQKALYSSKPNFNRWNSTTKKFDWTSLGVEYLMYDERTFITRMYHTDKGILEVELGGRSCRLELSPEDLVYWLLKEYDVPFNEEHFLATHFANGRQTAYSKFLGGVQPSIVSSESVSEG